MPGNNESNNSKQMEIGGERITSAEVADGLRLLRIHGSGALGFPPAAGGGEVEGGLEGSRRRVWRAERNTSGNK